MKDEKITKTAYIANSGGLLGLCMGFSLVSAAEILYHCLFGLFSPICGGGKRNNKDRLYRVYTYNKDAENGLCDRHQKAEIVKFSEYQKSEMEHFSETNQTELITESDLPDSFPPTRLITGSYPGHLNRPCLLHNGVVPTCPAHGPHGQSQPSNGTLPNQTLKYSFSPERVI